MDVIEVEGLTKSYPTAVGIENLTLSVPRGKILGLVGPNGAGKTTTLRAIAGIHPPTEGHVRICGFDIRDEAVEAKKNLAFFPDEPRLFDYLTVEEHLRFTGRLYGTPNVEAKMASLLDELELADKRKALPQELSRGMKQKLMIACGLLHDPAAMIFDEPLTGLDPLGIRRMKESILARAKVGSSVILSSHLLHLVEELCDTVAVIQGGKRIAFGSIADLKWEMSRGGAEVSLEDAFIRLTEDHGASEK